MGRGGDSPDVPRRASIAVLAQRTLVVGVVGAAVAVLAVGFVSTLSQPGKPGDEAPLVSALWQCSMVGSLLVGGLVTLKKPRNPVGWCLLAIPLLVWTSFTLAAEVNAAMTQGRPVPAWAIELEWLDHGVSMPVLVVVGLFILLGFPEGNLGRVGSRLLRSWCRSWWCWSRSGSSCPARCTAAVSPTRTGSRRSPGWATSWKSSARC